MHVVFQKLNETNYAEWAMKMEALLDEQDLWDVVTGDKVEPSTGPNSKAMKTFR